MSTEFKQITNENSNQSTTKRTPAILMFLISDSEAVNFSELIQSSLYHL